MFRLPGVLSIAAEERLRQIWETPHSLTGWLSTVDHKKIGHRYLVTAFVFLILGGPRSPPYAPAVGQLQPRVTRC